MTKKSLKSLFLQNIRCNNNRIVPLIYLWCYYYRSCFSFLVLIDIIAVFHLEKTCFLLAKICRCIAKVKSKFYESPKQLLEEVNQILRGWSSHSHNRIKIFYTPEFCFNMFLCFYYFYRFATPLCIFRWLLVLLVALIPISWYRGLRLMNISRAESLMAGLLFLVMNSQHQNGFEVSAYLKEGLIPQLYAQCLFPFAGNHISCLFWKY